LFHIFLFLFLPSSQLCAFEHGVRFKCGKNLFATETCVENFQSRVVDFSFGRAEELASKVHLTCEPVKTIATLPDMADVQLNLTAGVGSVTDSSRQ